MHALAERETLAFPAVALVAVLAGAIVAYDPVLALGAAGAGAVTVLAFAAPVAHLTLLLIATAIVPYGLLNAYGFGGSGTAGLVISDVLLLTGLARALLVLARERLGRRLTLVVLATLAWLVVASLTFVAGVRDGAVVSTAGNELRALLGFGALLIAVPILRDANQRDRLLRALLFVAIALGLSGLGQWFGGATFSANGDFGVREGIAYAEQGRGQLQGGLFGYPVAVILAFAALVAAQRRSLSTRLLLVGTLAINAVCVLLTYERTMWLVTVLGCAFVVLRARGVARTKVVLGSFAAAVAGLALLTAIAPTTSTAARDRLLSLRQYGSDVSVAYRVRESEHVLGEIAESPIAGSGLGDTIYWGLPEYDVPSSEESYTHNGFLWITWKAGLVGAVLLFGLILVAIWRRTRPRGSPTFATVVVGSQAALLALLVANVTFPSVSGTSATAMMGVLLALALVPSGAAAQP